MIECPGDLCCSEWVEECTLQMHACVWCKRSGSPEITGLVCNLCVYVNCMHNSILHHGNSAVMETCCAVNSACCPVKSSEVLMVKQQELFDVVGGDRQVRLQGRWRKISVNGQVCRVGSYFTCELRLALSSTLALHRISFESLHMKNLAATYAVSRYRLATGRGNFIGLGIS